MTRTTTTPCRTVDPITLEVLRNKLDGIADEMEATLIRSSFSPVVKESMDASASLFTIDGTTLAQATAIPIHLATLIPCVARIIETFPVATMREGDLFILNDPYLGGTHLPDFAVIMPVFHGEIPVALSCTMTHHQDVGGMTAGSVPTDATEIFQEGIRIPPLRLRSGDAWNDTLLALLKQNVRMPETFLGDLNAQVAGCATGARRVQELAAVYGTDQLAAMFAELLDRSERLTREAISALPDGRYTYVDFLDNDGVELDKRVRVEVTAIVEGDTIVFDFTGTSLQTTGPINAVPSGALAAAFFTVRAVTDPLIPTNGGCIRPVRLVLPEGSLVNPNEPAPVNTRTVTIKMMAACMLGAFRECIPDKIPASDAVVMNGIVWSGIRDDGSRYVLSEMIAGGSGAAIDRDGLDVIETDVTNCMNLPVESLEMNTPIRMHQCAIRPDSGGLGQYRGGNGVIREYELLEGTARITHRGERFFSEPPGTAGGESGMSGESWIVRENGEREDIPSKRVFTMHRGDRLVVQTPGGGGYGPAKARDADAIAMDLRNGKTTLSQAR
ncbi:N-methylhydantoinase B [Hyphomicrobiales bacterium]|nr:N-methylhydantoinase B [Hyphomicrobiales bacterium]